MPLIVETGAGLPDADSYLSTATMDTIAENRGWFDWLNTSDDAKKEAALREAAIYLDTIPGYDRRFKGTRLSADQMRAFPRQGLIDWEGLTVIGVPYRVKLAQAYLARAALTQPLYEDLQRGGRIAGESVAGISVNYETGAPVGLEFREAMKLLDPYMRNGSELYMPHDGAGDVPAAEPAFRLGQFDGREDA